MHRFLRPRFPAPGVFCLLVFLTLPLVSFSQEKAAQEKAAKEGAAAVDPGKAVEELVGDEPDNIDPWEPVNRKIFAFNEVLDRYLLRPVASGYHKVMPDSAERGVANAISNIYEFNSMFNGLLQGRPSVAATSAGRLMVNSTVGVFGLFDVATRMGIEQQKADFGQTLMVWGVGSGPYVVLPIFGPRTARSATGYFVDTYASIPYLALEREDVYLFWTIEAISYRAELLEYDDLITGDRYVFFRSAYLQSRATFLNDGVPPEDDFADSEDDLDWDEDF